MKTIAVIGSAGRKDDAKHMDRDLYLAMYEQTLKAIGDWGCDAAVSGGAALADHLAVRAYLDGAVDRLTLFLPARFEGRAFVPNPRIQFNPGQTSNTYHKAFSSACGFDSLGEIAEAIAKGASVEVHEGFHRRNLEVAAKATAMLALTFGSMEAPVDLRGEDPGFSKASDAGLKDGGTAHCWSECWRADVKRHVSLNWLTNEMSAATPPAAKVS